MYPVPDFCSFCHIKFGTHEPRVNGMHTDCDRKVRLAVAVIPRNPGLPHEFDTRRSA